MTKQDDFKILLNFVLINISSANNNKTSEEISENIKYLHKWQEDLDYRLEENYLTEEDYEFYYHKMNNIYDMLMIEFDEMNRI